MVNLPLLYVTVIISFICRKMEQKHCCLRLKKEADIGVQASCENIVSKTQD